MGSNQSSFNRFNIFRKYVANNRLEEYDQILKKARELGYQLISLRDFVEHQYEADRKMIILRHDVDGNSQGARKMFELEQKYGAHASYYFRHSTFNPPLMKDIEKYGSESSFHYEPIAEYSRARGITTKEELFKTNFEVECLQILKNDIERYRLLLQIPCTTIASHGAPENRLLDTPNNFLTENPLTYEALGIKLEAYNKEFISKITCYVSDYAIEINNGYKYGTHLFEAMKRGEKMILFLTHPELWHYEGKRRLKKVVKSILKAPERRAIHFKRI
ncbi:MAG: hypothetical protein JWM44_1919 [Bacilli bacterium]|nr:hypothetical protein [Bacilli bacterium]